MKPVRKVYTDSAARESEVILVDFARTVSSREPVTVRLSIEEAEEVARGLRYAIDTPRRAPGPRPMTEAAAIPFMTVFLHVRRDGTLREQPVPLEIHSRWSAIVLESMAKKLVLAHARKLAVKRIRTENAEYFDRVRGLLYEAGFEVTTDTRADLLASLQELIDEDEEDDLHG